jgi:hypothetical protein
MQALAEGKEAGGEPDEVWVLVPEPLGRIRGSAISQWLTVALRSLRGLSDEALAQVVRSPDVKLRVLHPRDELRGAMLDFDPAKLRAWYEDGLRTARAADLAA